MPALPWEGLPTELLEFEERFATEAACSACLTALQRPNGFRCPEVRGRSVSWEDVAADPAAPKPKL